MATIPLRSLISSLIVLSLFTSPLVRASISTLDIVKIVEEGDENAIIQRVVGDGTLDFGYFRYETFCEIKQALHIKYPDFVGEDITFGRSYLHRPLTGFLLGKQVRDKSGQQQKNLILVDSSHHARESTSLTMVLSIFLKELISLVHRKHSSRVYDYVSLLVYPVVNLDAVMVIDQDFKKNQRRKNMRKVGCMRNPEVDDGVDINRNYDIEFDSVPESTTDKCGDEFKGEKPFSEPETQAVRNITDSFPNIATALNFHAWGNLWVHPYNFLKPGQQKFMADTQPGLDRMYKDFEKNGKFPEGVVIGDARKVVQYSASGEASDWMAVKRNIFAWSPELGSKNPSTNEFYISPSLQREVVSAQMPTVEDLIEKHLPKLRILDVEKVVKNGDGAIIEIKIENESYSHLRYLNPKVQSTPEASRTAFRPTEDGVSIDCTSDEGKKLVVNSMGRFSNCSLRVVISDVTEPITIEGLGIAVEIDGKNVLEKIDKKTRSLLDAKLNVYSESKGSRKEEGKYFLGFTSIVFVFCFLLIGPKIIRQNCLRKSDRKQVADIIGPDTSLSSVEMDEPRETELVEEVEEGHSNGENML